MPTIITFNLATFWQEMWQAVAAQLGSLIGNVAGVILGIVLYILAVYLFWGFIWDRIITKAGFKGKAFRRLFLLMVVPVLLIPVGAGLEGEAANAFGGFILLTQWVGMMLVALLPWPVRKASKPAQAPKKKTSA